MNISQREAHRLQKRVSELQDIVERQRRHWVKDYPGGVHLGTIAMEERGYLVGRIEAARMLGHAVVLTSQNTKTSKSTLYQ